MRRVMDLLGEKQEAVLAGRRGKRTFTVGGATPRLATLDRTGGFDATVRLGDDSTDVQLVEDNGAVYVRAFGRTFEVRILNPVEAAARLSGRDIGRTRAPMPGTVVEIHAEPGDRVTAGQPLLTIESMKMFTVITAPADGEVESMPLGTGDTFGKNDTLVVVREKGGADDA
ncbi:MAG: acetyl-CoA carboxylase biotin carboxyl carrier protein subunit [Desulfatibacillaceae bacterium]